MSIATLAHHGRSFRLAGRLLPGATLVDAAGLYAFCRTVDDLADETIDPVVAHAALRSVRKAILAGDWRHTEAARFLALQDRTGVSTPAAIRLIAAGVLMCAVLDTRNPWAEAHAIDLGIAMQLTNIARDVMEDAARDRIYLPAAWLPPGMQPADIPDAAGPVFAVVQQVLARADRSYRSAELGYRYLPRRVRPAIRAAARLYEEIGLRVLRHGPGYLKDGRCVVSMPRKLLVLAKCLGERTRAGPHDPALHAVLCGLPGTHP